MRTFYRTGVRTQAGQKSRPGSPRALEILPMTAPTTTPVYIVGTFELVAMGVFLVVAIVAAARSREAIPLLAAAILFALRPGLIFAFPSHRLVLLTAYLPPLAFGCLAAFCWIRFLHRKTR